MDKKERWLAEALIQLSGGVECLSLTGRCMGEYHAASRLADAVKRNEHLRWLQLDNNGFDDASAAKLATGIKDHGALQTLDLDYNFVSDKGATALAKSLSTQGSILRDMQLHCNRIGTDGAIALAQALSVNRSLVSLSLHGNSQIGPAGGAELAKALSCNTQLRSLSLHGCRVRNLGAEQIARALKNNCVLKDLALSMNGIGDPGAAELASMLLHNATLQELQLDRNFIGDEGAQSVAAALEENRTLRDLWLMDNRLSKEVFTFFAEALKKNLGLQRLAISSVDDASDPATQAALASMRQSQLTRRAMLKMAEREALGIKRKDTTAASISVVADAQQSRFGQLGIDPVQDDDQALEDSAFDDDEGGFRPPPKANAVPSANTSAARYDRPTTDRIASGNSWSPDDDGPPSDDEAPAVHGSGRENSGAVSRENSLAINQGIETRSSQQPDLVDEDDEYPAAPPAMSRYSDYDDPAPPPSMSRFSGESLRFNPPARTAASRLSRDSAGSGRACEFSEDPPNKKPPTVRNIVGL